MGECLSWIMMFRCRGEFRIFMGEGSKRLCHDARKVLRPRSRACLKALDGSSLPSVLMLPLSPPPSLPPPPSSLSKCHIRKRGRSWHATTLFLAFLISSTSWCLIPPSAIHAFSRHPKRPSSSFTPLPLYHPNQCQIFQIIFSNHMPYECNLPSSYLTDQLLSTPALCRTSSLVNLSVQGIIIIRLKNHFSQLSKRFLRSDVIDHASLSYVTTG